MKGPPPPPQQQIKTTRQDKVEEEVVFSGGGGESRRSKKTVDCSFPLLSVRYETTLTYIHKYINVCYSSDC